MAFFKVNSNLIIGLLLGAVLLTAIGFFRAGGFEVPASFEEVAVRTEAKISGGCPLSDAELDAATLEQIAVCAEFGLPHYIAVQQYPKIGVQLYADYGGLPQWKQIVEQYGPSVLPVVESFRQNGSVLFDTQNQLGAAVRSALQGKLPEVQPALRPLEYGYMAIVSIAENGHNLLAQFEVVGGVATMRPITGTLRTVESFLIGGITDLEGKLVRGEDATYGDWGWAVFDGVLLIAGGSAVLKGVKSGAKTVKVGGRFAALKALGGKALKGVGKASWLAAKKTAPLAVGIGTAYVAMKHPVLVTSFAVDTLTAAGFSTGWAMIVTFGGIVLLMWPLLILGYFVLKGILWIPRGIWWLGKNMQPI